MRYLERKGIEGIPFFYLPEHAFYKYANDISIISSSCKFPYPILANILFKLLKISGFRFVCLVGFLLSEHYSATKLCGKL